MVNSKIQVLTKEDTFNRSYFDQEKNNKFLYAHLYDDALYQVLFSHVSQQYESGIYAKYLKFNTSYLPHAKNNKSFEYIQGLIFNKEQKILFFNNHKPVILKDFSYHGVDPRVAAQLNKLATDLKYYSFNEILNIPVTY